MSFFLRYKGSLTNLCLHEGKGGPSLAIYSVNGFSIKCLYGGASLGALDIYLFMHSLWNNATVKELFMRVALSLFYSWSWIIFTRCHGKAGAIVCAKRPWYCDSGVASKTFIDRKLCFPALGIFRGVFRYLQQEPEKWENACTCILAPGWGDFKGCKDINRTPGVLW